MFNPFFHPLRQALLNYAPAVNGASPLIQRGSFTIPSGQLFADHTISEVDLSLASLFWSGISGDAAESDKDMAEVYFLNSTTIRAQRSGGAAGVVCSIEFCLIVFPAAVISSIQTGHITMTNAETTQTLTISEVDLAKSIVLYNGTRINTATGTHGLLVRLYFDDSTTVRASRAAPWGTAVTALTVIEFS